jgi:hypothetical protein
MSVELWFKPVTQSIIVQSATSPNTADEDLGITEERMM